MHTIYHIYWGTSGNSGLYLHEIYQVLQKNGFHQRAFVNYYFPFDYGDKIFFKRGDIAYGTAEGRVRKIFQLMEVLKGYFIILCCSLKDKPAIINYSHVGSSFFFIPLYLKLLKKVSCAKLVITCHDVMPHSGAATELKNRKRIFFLADNLLVHTESSANELVKNFNVERNKIVKHLFPIMDLSLLAKNDEKHFTKTDFLFIGHLRKDKGVDFLMSSWKKFHSVCPDARLRLCGKKQPTVTFNGTDFIDSNVEFNLHFISDDDYYGYVKSARYVLLPYLQGTNSGIISTVLSLGTEVITSDIPMFTENPLVSSDDVFKVGDENSFLELLQNKYKSTVNSSSDKLDRYRADFKNEVLGVYQVLIDNSLTHSQIGGGKIWIIICKSKPCSSRWHSGSVVERRAVA